MKIETKYCLKEKIFYLSNNEVCTGEITTVHAYITADKQYEEYFLGSRDLIFNKDRLFKTKQELLDSL